MRKQSSDKTNRSSQNKQEGKKEKNSQTKSKMVKKTKSGFAKLKNQLEDMNAKKIMQFVKKSTRTIPQLLTREQSKALLPKLQKIVFPNTHETSMKSKKKFEELENQLTHSMVIFKQNVEQEDLWAIDLQTQKCYQTIPNWYYQQQVEQEDLTRHLALTKNFTLMQESMFCLMDYRDQVEFNINQQVGAKMKKFMNFVMCMNSIQDLVKMNTQKIAATRNHTRILRDIIVSRSVRINQQRQRKQNIQEALIFLQLLKRMKVLEGKLNTQISLGNYISQDGKTKMGSILAEYFQLHNNELKTFCCRSGKNLCKYWEITYFIEKGFQDNFIKNVRNYLFEVIDCQHEVQKYKKAFVVNKKKFMTTPSNFDHADMQHSLLDESYQVDAYDHVELITKIHIQKQIISILEQGMTKYSFPTDQLSLELISFLDSYVNSFLKGALNSTESDIKQTLKDLQDSKQTFILTEKFKEKITKASWTHFDKIMEMIILRFEYLNERLFSLNEKIFAKAASIEKEQPQRFEVLCAYFSQLINTNVRVIDSHITNILKHRVKEGETSISFFKAKEEIYREFDIQSDNMKKLVKHCKKWLQHIYHITKDYPLCKKEIQKALLKSQKHIRQQKSLSPQVQQLKGTLAKNALQLFHKTLVSRDLRSYLEQDNWQFIQIKAEIYNDLGYIIGGNQFLLEEQRNQKNLLSKSILISGSQMQKSHHIYNKDEYSSRFKINPSYITLGGWKFKSVGSTQQMIKMLRKYLQMYDDNSCDDKKKDLLSKLTEIVLMYNEFVRQLILKGGAVDLGRVKTKSITAKHLIIAYMQLQAVNMIFTGYIMQNRAGFSTAECEMMHNKIIGTMQQIRKKYQHILQLRIIQSVSLINAKQQNILESGYLLSIPKNFQNSIELFTDLMLSQSQFKSFLNMDSKWAAQLLSKVMKGPKGNDLKRKVFTFLDQELQPFANYIQKLMLAIKSVLS